MHLPRLIIAVTFAVASFAGTTIARPAAAQSNVRPSGPTGIRPFVSLAVGPAILASSRFNNGGDHPALEVTAGARIRSSGLFGLVVAANTGKMLNTVIGGEYAVCRARIDGQPGCYPNTPLSNWFGLTAGGELYLGRTILGLQAGSVAVGVPQYERDLVPGSPSRAWGLRTQFDAHFPIYRQLGITLSAADRYVPKILNEKWHISSFTVGLSIR